jgi:hypothetical protein
VYEVMAHNGYSRPEQVSVRVDSKTLKKLKEYEKLWGIGHCVLGVACFYIGFKELEKLDDKIKFVYGKPISEILPKIMSNEEREYFTPFSDLFCQEGIPTNLWKDVEKLLSIKAHEIEENKKTEEEIENE